MAEYFYTDAEGKIRGPVPYKKLHAMAAFGSVPHDARVMEVGVQADAGGEQPWRPIAEVLPPDTMPPPPPLPRQSSLGAWSFLMGVMVFLLGAFAPAWFSGPVGVAAVVCGHMAFMGGRSAAMTTGFKTLAIIGLILGYMGIVLGFGGITAFLNAAMQQP